MQTQEEEAKKMAKDKARELTKARAAAGAGGGAGRRGLGAFADSGAMAGGGMSGVSGMEEPKPAYQPPAREPRYPSAFSDGSARYEPSGSETDRW